MPMKRSRIGSSSSHQVMQLSTADTAAVNSSTGMKPSKILDIECPVGFGEFDQLKIGGFLERCHFCRKRISQNSEVFMYSNLCAFCTAECRDRQIALDHLANKKSANPKGKMPRG